MALNAAKLRAMNQKMPGLETVQLLDEAGDALVNGDDAVIANAIRAERRPVTKKSVFNIVEIQSDSLEWVLHDDGSGDVTPRDGMIIQAGSDQYSIQQGGVVTRMLGTRYHCLCVLMRGTI